MPAGYSSNPLYKKLGIKAGALVKTVNAPAQYRQLIGNDVPAIFDNSASSGIDVIHLFTNSLKEYEQMLPVLMAQIKKDGTIWVSWYKKSSGLTTELTENIIRDTALAAGLVDVKVCAVDEDWSGLKLVFRLKDR